MAKGLLVIALLAITFLAVRSLPVELTFGEFTERTLAPNSDQIFTLELDPEQLSNRTFVLGIITSDTDIIEEDEQFGTNLTVVIGREYPNDTSEYLVRARSAHGVAFWPSDELTEGVYYVVVFNLQQINATFNITYLLMPDTPFELNAVVQPILTSYEISYFNMILDHSTNILMETTALRVDVTFDSLTPILSSNTVEQLLTISQGDYPTPSRHLERADIASQTQFMNEQNQTVFRLTLFEEIPMTEYMNMSSSRWFLGFFNTGELDLQASFVLTLIDRSPGILEETDQLTLINNRPHMLKLGYFVTPETIPEAMVYFEVNLPRPLLPSEKISISLFNTFVPDSTAIRYELNANDSVVEYFIGGRQSQEVASRDYSISLTYTGPSELLATVLVTPRSNEVYPLPLFSTIRHDTVLNRRILYEIPVIEYELPNLQESRISTVFHLAFNVVEEDITIDVRLRRNRIPTAQISDATSSSALEDLFLEIPSSQSFNGKWYAFVEVYSNVNTNESLPYSISASVHNRFNMVLNTNIINNIQPQRWHYYKASYTATANHGIFFDLSYTNWVEGFEHEISRELNFLVSNQNDNPFPTFANNDFASSLYWTDDDDTTPFVFTRQNVYVPASAFVTGSTYKIYTGVFVAPVSTQPNHAYELLAKPISEVVLTPGAEQSVNGHTWAYFTTQLSSDLTLGADQRFVGEVHLTSQSNFNLNVSVALNQDTYPTFAPHGDTVRDLGIFGELSYFTPITMPATKTVLAVRNWSPIVVHFNLDARVHVETAVASLPHSANIQVAPQQYHFFRATRSPTPMPQPLRVTLERQNKKRDVEQALASFFVLLSKNGEYPAVSDYEAGAIFGQRFSSSDATSFEFEASISSTTVVYAIYNDGDAPLSFSVDAALISEELPPTTLNPVTPDATPVSTPSTATPVATTPVSVPTVQTPVNSAPVSGTPVSAPVATAPQGTNPPSADTPVQYTPVSVAVPITEVTQAPSDNDIGLSPLYIGLIVAGGLAIIGIVVAVLIKVVQTRRRNAHGLSGLEYVELVDEKR